MKIIICAVYDKKAKEFQAPFAQQNKPQAVRSFMNVCKDEKGLFNQFPADFALYQLGTVDLSTGRLETCAEVLLEAESVVSKYNSKNEK